MAKYTAKDITVLEGLEPVRKRPGMYIGGVGSTGLHHLVWEILDNSIDEAMNGFASEVNLQLHEDGKVVTVTDNGRGIPVDRHPKTKQPAIEVILTTLHAGGKFGDTTYRTSGGLHGVGASVVNALSVRLMAQVRRDNCQWKIEFVRGKATGKLKKTAGARGTGTRITFEPDPQIFPKVLFDSKILEERMRVASYLHRGIRFIYDDKVEKKRTVFKHDRGIEDYVDSLLKERKAHPTHGESFVIGVDDGMRAEIVLRWTDSTDEYLKSFVNGIPTRSGGNHESGLRAGVVKAVRSYIEVHKIAPKGLSLGAEDIREGLVGVLSVFISDPQFQGQTKDRLNNPEVQAPIDGAVRKGLEAWLNHNRTTAEAIVARIVLAARARAASRAASAEVKRKGSAKHRLNLPGKLSDCNSNDPEQTELFIVEGDSAGGSAKQGRSREHQAILPLRGKVLNTEGLPLSKVLGNKEIADLVVALGCGIGNDLDLGRLRYGRIILLADADSDGHHITTLLLTFFFRHLRPLVEAGRLYIARPPLFRIQIGKETHWASDEADRDRILEARSRKGKVEITRFKGLGEMMPATLWETTLDPASRQLYRVEITEALTADRVFDELMGKDPSARFRFIMSHADTADALDL